MVADPRLESLRFMLDVSPLAMLVSEHSSGRILALNELVPQLFQTTEAEVIGRTLVELGFWDSKAARDTFLEQVAAHNGSETMEIQIQRSSRHCVLSSRLLHEDGLPDLILSTLQDITQLRMAQDATQRSERRLERVVQSLAEGVIALDAQSVVIQGNNRAHEILGLSAGSLVGKPLFVTESALVREDGSVLPHEELPACQTMHDGQPRRDFVFGIVRPDGSRLWINANSAVLERDMLGIPSIVLVSFTDITERRRMEEEVIRERLLTEALFNSVPGLIYLYDGDGRLVRWNKKHEMMTGYTPDELSRMRLVDWYEGDEPSLNAVLAGVKTTLESGYGEAMADLRRKDGTRIPMFFSAALLTLDGQPHFAGIGIDITERRKQEDALRESESMYRLLAESSLDMVTRHDLDGTYLWASPSTKTLLGFDPEEMIGTSSLEMVHPDDRENVLRSLSRILDTPVTVNVVYRHKTKTGSWIWVESVSRALRDPIDGKALEINVSTRDISERRAAEERYRCLFENLTTGFALHEIIQDESGAVTDYRFLEVNPAYTRLTGLTPELVLEKTVRETLPDIETYWIETFGHVALTGESIRFENYAAPLDKWYETWAYRTTPGQFAVLVTDVTERKKQEEALRRSESDYRLLAENSTDVISRVARDGTITYLSPSVEAALGWPPEHFIGTNSMQGIHPDDLPVLREAAAHARATGKGGRPIYRSQRRDGSWIWVETSLHPLLDAEGNIDGMVASSRDVTARIDAEQALKEREQRLRLVLEATSDGVFDWDIPSGYVHYSPAIFTMLGYEVGGFTGQYETWLSLLHPEDTARVLPHLEAHLDDPSVVFRIEFRMRTCSGGWKWIQARGRVVERTTDGKPLRMVGTHTDISERKATEIALAESEERWRFLAENSLDVVLRLDSVGTVLWASPSIETVLDQDLASSIGASSLDHIHPEDRDRVARELASTLQSTGTRKAVYRHITRHGRILWVESIGRAIRDPRTGEVQSVLVSTRDITEQLRQSQLLEDTQRMAHVGGWEFHFDTTTTVWTREMKRLFGLDQEDPPLPLETLKSLLEPQSLKLYEESFDKMLRDGSPWDIMLRGRTIDGKLLLTRLTCDSERGSDGNLVAIRGSMQDVTESELLRERLESTSHLNQSILSTTQALIVLMDREGRVVRFNHACEQISGWNEEEVVGRQIFEILIPEPERSAVRRVFANLTEDAIAGHHENHWQHRDGTIAWISWANSVLRDEKGEIQYVLGTGIDMTAHRATQQELLETQERWRVLIETAPEAILILDTEEGRFLQANPAAEALFDLPEHEILARGPQDFSPPFQPSGIPSVEAIDIHVRKALEGAPITFDWMHRRLDGRELLCQVNLSRLPSEGRRLLRASLVDVTDRRKTDSVMEALVKRTSSLFGQAFFEALARDLTVILGVRHSFVARISRDGAQMHNSAFVADGQLSISSTYPVAGSPCEEVVRNGMAFLPKGARDRYPGSRLLDDLDAESFMAVALRSVDGTVIGILAVADPKPMAGDEIAQSILAIFAGRAQGEMERHETDLALRRLNNELERRVEERTAELVASNRELESFSYSVSHDLRSPLRSINGFAQALDEDYTALLGEEGRNYLSRIRSASQRMAELIDDLLSLSQSSRRVLRKSDVDLSAMATEILERMRTSEPERNIRWEIEPELRAFGDPTLLQAVLENLLGNAWKYTRRRENAWIRFRSDSHTETRRRFAVEDNGAGFDMSFASKLFGTFQRLHHADEFEGNGIGLATVKRILERHGGSIEGRGEVGKGATFVFELPQRW